MKLRRTMRVRAFSQLFFILVFPVILNFMSPYVIVDGAARGIISGSALVFAALFLTSPFLGRLWCSWVCPAGAIQDQLIRVRPRRFTSRAGDHVKLVIWAVWMGTIVYFFLSAGISAVRPLHLTESGISVDAPARYIIYFGVIAVFVSVALIFGRRAACHTVCWMAPFMMAGRKIGSLLRLPGVRIAADPDRCTLCGTCEKVCPMSLGIGRLTKAGRPEHSECIQCGECAAACPSEAISLRFIRPRAPRKQGRASEGGGGSAGTSS